MNFLYKLTLLLFALHDFLLSAGQIICFNRQEWEKPGYWYCFSAETSTTGMIGLGPKFLGGMVTKLLTQSHKPPGGRPQLPVENMPDPL